MSFTLKMEMAVFSETLEKLQHMAQLHHKKQNYTSDTHLKNLRMRILLTIVTHKGPECLYPLNIKMY
jgi:hypothetical protein